MKIKIRENESVVSAQRGGVKTWTKINAKKLWMPSWIL